MKAKTSIFALFVAGAILASLPFLVSRGPVKAQVTEHQPLALSAENGQNLTVEDDWIFVVHKDKLFKVHKA